MKNRIISILKDCTKHDNIYLTERGNKAIFAALKIAREKSDSVLIPDQGSWLTYFQYAEKLKFNIQKLKTGYGVIDLNVLKENVDDASAIIYSNPAAYYAEQPVKEIYEICKKNNIIVILDISGCIGSDYYNGNYADIIVCSFGKWKPVNLMYGGFISTNNKGMHEKNNTYLENLEFEEKYYTSLYEKLVNLKNRYEFLKKINNKVKHDLKEFNVLYKDKKGINVIVKFDNEQEKNRVIDYCKKNKYEFVECPKMIKVNENAISIEVKRLE